MYVHLTERSEFTLVIIETAWGWTFLDQNGELPLEVHLKEDEYFLYFKDAVEHFVKCCEYLDMEYDMVVNGDTEDIGNFPRKMWDVE